ncbi:response regulator [Microbacterium sp. ZW T5_56]|uniref:response regulator n=1 Tax=Microbacterium sp. ZW T5_56 TaxID=3378081 RepID=UPI003852E82B
MSVRVLIVDDHAIVRAGLRALLAADDGIEVVADIEAAEDAAGLAAEHAVDVVLMDLQFHGRSAGVDATRAVRALPHPPAVLVLTNYDTDSDILAAIEAGANGYLLKDAPLDDLLAAIHAAAHGESALAPAIASRLIERMRTPQRTLTARELAVLELAGAGLSNRDLAQRLHVTESTVKTHLANIYAKLGVASRTAAIAAARGSGMIR